MNSGPLVYEELRHRTHTRFIQRPFKETDDYSVNKDQRLSSRTNSEGESFGSYPVISVLIIFHISYKPILSDIGIMAERIKLIVQKRTSLKSQIMHVINLFDKGKLDEATLKLHMMRLTDLQYAFEELN